MAPAFGSQPGLDSTPILRASLNCSPSAGLRLHEVEKEPFKLPYLGFRRVRRQVASHRKRSNQIRNE